MKKREVGCGMEGREVIEKLEGRGKIMVRCTKRDVKLIF